MLAMSSAADGEGIDECYRDGSGVVGSTCPRPAAWSPLPPMGIGLAVSGPPAPRKTILGTTGHRPWGGHYPRAVSIGNPLIGQPVTVGATTARLVGQQRAWAGRLGPVTLVISHAGPRYIEFEGAAGQGRSRVPDLEFGALVLITLGVALVRLAACMSGRRRL